MFSRIRTSKDLNIGIFAPSGLGDSVMIWPLLKSIGLATRFGVRAVIFTKEQVSEDFFLFFKKESRFDNIEVVKIPSLGLRKLDYLITLFKLRYRHLDYLILPQTRPSVATNILALLFYPVRVRTNSWREFSFLNIEGIGSYGKLHKSLLANRLSPVEPVDITEFYGPQSTEIKSKCAGHVLGVLPGSGAAESHKRLPLDHYVEIGRRFLKRFEDSRIKVFVSQAERQLATDFADRLGNCDERIEVIYFSSFNRTISEFQDCALMLSHCTGTAHLATFVGVPSILCYGPTSFDFTGPNRNVFAVHDLKLACSPCYLTSPKGCGLPVCMSNHSVDSIFYSIETFLTIRST